MRRYPSIELTFRTTVSTEQTIANILNGTADVGFASMAVYSPGLKVTPLFEDELVLAVGLGHRLAGLEAVAVDDLERERLILFERGASIRRATDEFFNRVGIQPTLALESNDTYFIKLMVEHGLGVSLLPGWAVKDDVAAGKIASARGRPSDPAFGRDGVARAVPALGDEGVSRVHPRGEGHAATHGEWGLTRD
ncbi:MAG: LysR family transcriptional regulator substrate-binding protein [Blastocatellia bacterium]|nr:LysR family transcriptional regulator substrate-binding protein [Blastocatellia bacterium]